MKTDKPIEIDATQIEDLANQYPFVVIDCWSPTCPPCMVLAPIIEQLAKELAGKVVFGKVNLSRPDNRMAAIEYEISGIPTLLVFKNGELVNTLVGFRSKQELRADLGL